MNYIGVILVGGKGRRLGDLTKNTPKPLIKINGLSFIKILLYRLCQYNFKTIYLICSYKSDQFIKEYNNKYILGVRIICLVEKKPKDTGGALYEIKNKIKSDFFLINGDTFFDIDLDKFYLFTKKLKTEINLALVKNKNYKSNRKLINISISNKNKIIIKKNKSLIMNGGIYLIKKNFLKKISNKKISLENDILQRNINLGNVSGQIYNNYFIDIGLKKNLKKAKKDFKLFNHSKCFFLDRDGVINKDKGYTYKVKDLKLLTHISKIIKHLNKRKFLIIIVTNQSGIGRGYYSEKQFNYFNEKLVKRLEKKNAHIDDIFFCPHHPFYGKKNYKKNCRCRKPNNGMLLDAIQKWGINTKKSFMIGDKLTDYMAAIKTKIKFFYFSKNLYKQIRKI